MTVAIIGAGVSGLACAWLLQKQGVAVKVLEREPYVGGLARSFHWHGFTCDFATHRLFAHDPQVLQELLALVPMVRHTRRSRIWLGGKWLRDPVNIVELLYRHPSLIPRVGWTYLARPRDLPQDSFESYVVARYGTVLDEFFFAPYTEKLFGIEAANVSVEWARRKVRIGGLLSFLRESSKKHFSYFYYPVQGGYGAIVDRLYQDVKEQVLLEAEVCRLEHSDNRIQRVVYRQNGREVNEQFSHVISTVPLPVLGDLLGEDLFLPYRGASAVYLLVDRPLLTQYHWIYFIDRSVVVNRMAEFKNLSPVEQPTDRTVLCAEVTNCDRDVAERVIADVVATGLLTPADVLDVMVERYDFAYPVYDRRWEAAKSRVQSRAGRFANLHGLGRSAVFEHWELDDAYAGAVRLAGQLTREMQAVRPMVGVLAEEGATMAPSDRPLVYAVVLTYNNVSDTIECLRSIQQMDYPNLRVLVVDNGSTDGTPDQVRRLFPDVELIENSSNLGVPWGFNVGFGHALRAGATYVLMLNNDTVMDSDMLTKLVEEGTKDDQTAVLMPKVLYYGWPERVWSVGGRYRRFPPAIVLIGRDKPDGERFERPRLLEYAPSCGLLIHRRAFERAGLFDPGYFFFFDDWDFCERVRAHGMHIRLVPEARLYHKVGRTTGRGGSPLYWRVMGESSVRFYRRHGRPVWFSLIVHIGYLVLREFVIQRKWHGFKDFMSGVRAGLEKPLGSVPAWDREVDGVASQPVLEDVRERSP